MRTVIFYLLTVIITLLAGMLIFFFVSSGTVIRDFGGDLVIVIFLYALLKVFYPKFGAFQAAGLVLAWALGVETLQYFHVPDAVKSNSPLVELLLGSTFQWLDVAMYILGLCLILCLEHMLTKPNNVHPK